MNPSTGISNKDTHPVTKGVAASKGVRLVQRPHTDPALKKGAEVLDMSLQGLQKLEENC